MSYIYFEKICNADLVELDKETLQKLDKSKDLIKEAKSLEASIKDVKAKIRKCEDEAEAIVEDIVYAIDSVEDMRRFFVKNDIRPISLTFLPKIHENSFGDDTDYNKTEWCDVQCHAVRDLISKFRSRNS